MKEPQYIIHLCTIKVVYANLNVYYIFDHIHSHYLEPQFLNGYANI